MTAYDITHGAGGLWEVHTWTAANGLSIDLNEQDVSLGVRIEDVKGLHSLPDREDPRGKRIGRTGENRYPRTPGGKTVGYVVELRGPTLPAMRALRTATLAAFADPRPGVMQLVPHSDIGGPVGQFAADVLECDIPEVQTSQYFRRAGTIGLRLSDPRIYFPSLAVSGSGTVTNTGTAPAEPVVTIAGASGDVTLTDGTHTLTWQDVPSGSLVVDFAKRTAKVGSVHAQPVVADCDWWDNGVDGIAPGATVTIAQTGGSGVTVAFVPAVW